MSPNPRNPWCIRCRVTCWTAPKSGAGKRGFRCPKCGRNFLESSQRNLVQSKIQDARWLLWAGLSQSEVTRRLHCRKSICKRAIALYGLPPSKPPVPKPLRKRVAPAAMREVWPYDNTDPLVVLVGNSVPRTLPEEVREEVAQEMLLSVLETLNKPEKFIRRYWQNRPFAYPIDDSLQAQRMAG